MKLKRPAEAGQQESSQVKRQRTCCQQAGCTTRAEGDGKGGKAIKCTRHGGGSRCQQEAVSHPHEDAAPWDAGCDGVRRFPKVRLDGCACPKTSGTHSIMCDDHYSLLMSRLVLDQRHCRMESVARWPAWKTPDCQFIQPPRVQSQPIPSIDVVDDITTPPFWLPEQVDVVITPYS